VSQAASTAQFHSGFVTLFGWTNVGKSTLLNRLVGTRIAAVAEVAQTTRHRVVGVRSLAGRGQIAFVDTPGIHHPRHRMNRAMVELARLSARQVDLAMLVVDAARGIGPGDREAAEILAREASQRLVVLNKIDRVRPKGRLLPVMQTVADDWGYPAAFPVSATTGDGCDALIDHLLERLPVAPAPYPQDFLTDQPERVLVAELVRERLIAATREEVPHALAVVIERWEQRADGLLAIEATVLVDKPSHKKIVVGRQGGVLKQVGTEARAAIEGVLGRRIYLGLWVKVSTEWRDDETTLRRLGLL